jgi:RNA polymerase sigma factor (sigma-70 family)
MDDNWNTRVTLLQRVKDSDNTEAWEEMVSYYRGFIKVVLLYLNLNENDMDDLEQEILLGLWKSMQEFDFDKQRGKFRTWFGRLIRNKVIDHYRKVKRLSDKNEIIASEGGARVPLFSEPEIENLIQKEWEAYVVEIAMERVAKTFSERAMQAFTMSMDNIPIETIAEELELKTNSVTKFKNRVKDRLIKEIHQLKNELELVE